MVKCRLARHTATGGHVNLTLDARTSSNKVPYLGITCHWMDELCTLHDCVLAFRHLRGSHTGDSLANVVLEKLEEFNLIEHLLCITADNASVNDKLCKVLEVKLQGLGVGWKRKDGQIRCMAHVLNLAAQKIMVTLRAEANVAECILAEGMGDASSQSDGSDSEDKNDLEVIPNRVLQKVCQLLSKIRASNLLWEALEREAIAVKIKPLSPLLDMKVR